MSKMVRNMMRLIFACVVFGMSSSAFIDTLFKCSVKDSACQKKLFQNSFSSIGKTGIPELDIPPTDPFHIENVSVSVLNLVNITLVDGVAKGIKNCVFDEFKTDFDTLSGKMRIICNVVIKGHYKVSAASPLIESVLGGSEVHGEGNAKVKVDQLLIELDFPFTAKKHDDGEIYLRCNTKETDRKFEVLGKMTFAADNIFLGKEDVSEIVVKFLNENWKFIMATFGRAFWDKVADFYFKYTGNFFENVPAKYYIIEDLTQYLQN